MHGADRGRDTYHDTYARVGCPYQSAWAYTQDGEHWYYGTRSHLADWCGSTKGTVSNCLRSLVEKGLLKRREVEHFGCIQVQYQAVQNFDTPTEINDAGANKNCDTPLSNFDIIDKKEINNKNNPNNKRFVPPTPEQVREYMQSRGTPIDADSFCDYWESVGWMRGKTKMKDWKAAARQWAKNDARWNRRGETDADLEEYLRRLDF